MALIPARVKLARLQEELILESKYLSSKSLSLEQRASKAVKVLKRNLSQEQWNTAKYILSPAGLTEIDTGNMSDSDAAKAIADLAKELANVPLKSRIYKPFIDSLMHHELTSRGIELPSHYEIKLTQSNNLDVKNTHTADKQRSTPAVYSTVLFPNELVHENGVLILRFPQGPHLS